MNGSKKMSQAILAAIKTPGIVKSWTQIVAASCGVPYAQAWARVVQFTSWFRRAGVMRLLPDGREQFVPGPYTRAK